MSRSLTVSWWVARSCLLVAGGIAVYLSWLAIATADLPLGCAPGSGCDSVLSSRWSRIFGIPVGCPAAAVYLTMCLLTFQTVLWSRWLLMTLGMVVLTSAVWFTALQLFVLHSLCPWCMADHVFGGLGSALVIALSVLTLPPTGRATQVLGSLAGGTLLACCGIAIQGLSAVEKQTLVRLPAGQNADSGPGALRQVAVLNGKIVVPLATRPHWGSLDAPQVLLVLQDYACPHCRATHQTLAEAGRRYGNQVTIVLLPCPLNANCNPKVEETEPRFADSCELARLALAVWDVSPAQFSTFEDWLFEPEKPRKKAAALAFAKTLVPAAELDLALSHPSIDERLAVHTQAYAAAGGSYLPVIMSPALGAVVGRPSAESLFQLLESELKLQQATE